MQARNCHLTSMIFDGQCVAALQPEGLKEMYGLISFYKENAQILKKTFQVSQRPVLHSSGNHRTAMLPSQHLPY